ncbi:hypothetical protein CDAR_310381 [Caerostris darwini]|uniref:Uncharacterized protein n=1 Tax=Caerostris darwini TaxID=1538125 RepID=A0AAV4RMN6_9ARAC|nr:hypothetical protein CDAR_310381 [Caerostris darwini]
MGRNEGAERSAWRLMGRVVEGEKEPCRQILAGSTEKEEQAPESSVEGTTFKVRRNPTWGEMKAQSNMVPNGASSARRRRTLHARNESRGMLLSHQRVYLAHNKKSNIALCPTGKYYRSRNSE